MSNATTPPAGARDAVADAAESLRGLAGVIRKHGTCAPAALELVAERLEALAGKADDFARVAASTACPACGSHGPCVDAEACMRTQATQPAAPGAGEGRVSLTHDELRSIKDAAYRDGYERRHIEVLAALA